jgi:hypothetical protein
MRVEDAIAITEQLISTRLTEIQRTILIKAWEGQSYIQIAQLLAYNEGYVKSVGADLWQLLSDALGERVSKHNFREILTRTTPATTPVAPAIYHSTSESVPLPTARRRDWYEMVDVSEFCGRDRELTTLTEWIVQDCCRLVAIAGSGGIGKTILAAKLVNQLHSQYGCVVWRSLLHAPSLNNLLAALLQIIAPEQEIPVRIDERLSRLSYHLHQSPCLIVLDNFESLFQEGALAGHYRSGFENYALLLRLLGEIPHQSAVVLTSREIPDEVTLMAGPDSRVRALTLTGLQIDTCTAILQQKGIVGQATCQNQLIQRYQGHPLVLKIVATAICELFDGNIPLFLKQETSLCSGIRQLLEQQFNRLSDVEHRIMYWFVMHRSATTVAELQFDGVGLSRSQILEGMASLCRRSLMQWRDVHYTLPSIVMEYATEHFIDQVCQEILTRQLVLFRSHTILNPQLPDYLQDIQRHLMVQPLLDRLIKIMRSPHHVLQHLEQMLSTERQQAVLESGYVVDHAIDNLIHLLQVLNPDLSHSDFSPLNLWQVDLLIR